MTSRHQRTAQGTDRSRAGPPKGRRAGPPTAGQAARRPRTRGHGHHRHGTTDTGHRPRTHTHGGGQVPENANEVTAAGIARLAGVGRAAVSNWRRRHADFPKPVGGTETSPAFALAEIERWLREQGKLAEVPLRERVWQQLAAPTAPDT
ncbi:helix-turn-helix transcriptional regulator, partial [Streptomyces clavuligerus]